MITGYTITVEQVRKLRAELLSEGTGVTLRSNHMPVDALLTLCDEALGTVDHGDRFEHLPEARARDLIEVRRQWSLDLCAEILNARSTLAQRKTND